MDLTPIFLQRLDITAELISNVKTDQLDDATPCADFNVRQLLNHMIGEHMGFALALGGTRIDASMHPSDLVADAGDDPAAAIAPVLEQAKAAWTAPGALDQESVPLNQGMPAKALLRIALLEAVVHGWDLATATNQPYEIPDQLAEPMLDGLRKQAANWPRGGPGPFAEIVEIPDSASAADKLIAFTGRTP